MVDLDQCTHATINGCDKKRRGWYLSPPLLSFSLSHSPFPSPCAHPAALPDCLSPPHICIWTSTQWGKAWVLPVLQGCPLIAPADSRPSPIPTAPSSSTSSHVPTELNLSLAIRLSARHEIAVTHLLPHLSHTCPRATVPLGLFQTICLHLQHTSRGWQSMQSAPLQTLLPYLYMLPTIHAPIPSDLDRMTCFRCWSQRISSHASPQSCHAQMAFQAK